MPIDHLWPPLSLGAWVWDKYGKTIADKAVGEIKDRWEKVKWKDAAETYRKKVKKLYGTMQIMGMAEPVPLDNIFTEVYMLDKPTALGRFDIEHLKRLSADPNAPPPNAKRIGGLTLVNKKNNLFILGKPGAGKTTFLRYIAVQAAEPEKPIIDKVPIFISLKHWADSNVELMPFIAERFDICGFPDAKPFVEELLKSGSAIVLFDGLDEVNQESGQRDRQTRSMNNFIEKYDRTQYLITCRIAASDYSFEPFTYVEIADFTERQIETFVGNWFRNQEGEKDEELCKKFLAEFEKGDNEGLRDLARTPLLLTWLCLAFSEILTFPQRRADLYKEVLDVLLKKWDSSKRVKRDEIYHKLSSGHKENMLARIAAETFEKKEYFIPQAELERIITDYVRNIPPHDMNESTDAEAILKAIETQHGILMERAHKVYSFSHLTFQEYFTAKYIIDNAARGTLTNLITAHCWDVRWREVLLLTTSLLPDASQFLITFRSIVDKLLGENEKLKALLSWAARKAALIEGDPWIIRPTYLHDGLSSQTENPALKNVLEFVLLRALSFTPDRVLDIVLCRDLGYALSRDSSLNLTDAMSLAYNLAREGNVKLDELVNDLYVLHVPTAESTNIQWQKFTSTLRGLMIKHRDIGYEWNLTDEEEAYLAAYIIATCLLQDCLELATMPLEEKNGVLNSLYLPRAQENQS